ncbi:zinc finger protein 862-like [Xenia sp. Carnegie-2017]|uniref:zinc finger protein 862-like n=1 Tax=Xenia sp. Carnegie-2017 TaxID=2897299 RepID=UPI001F049832|nr:zinc finger protein 862-like [Xenia sp. Carnegie-2017]
MAVADRERMEYLFNATYTECKEELPFKKYIPICELLEKCGVDLGKSYRTDRSAAELSDHISGVMKGNLDEDLKDARYLSVLCDCSTDTCVKSQELFYVLYVNKNGRSTCKLMSVETVENDDAAGLKEAMNEAFARFGITNFESKLAATGLDGASVNMGRNTGLAARLKEVAPWLTVVHCFNHRLELAAADAFNATFFAQVDEILRQLFSLYQKSPKKLRELKKLAEVYGETVSKKVDTLDASSCSKHAYFSDQDSSESD